MHIQKIMKLLFNSIMVSAIKVTMSENEVILAGTPFKKEDTDKLSTSENASYPR